jgi:tRNA-specific 2-thiouridylase
VDEDGNRLGTHKGITHYTIGQRKGLGIALGHPIYVKEIRAASNEVVLSDEPALFSREVLCRDVNFLSIPGMDPGQQIPAKAKIRYHHQAADAVLEMQADGCVRILFDDPVRAAAPGQSAVFYDADDCVIGGGIIVK